MSATSYVTKDPLHLDGISKLQGDVTGLHGYSLVQGVTMGHNIGGFSTRASGQTLAHVNKLAI